MARTFGRTREEIAANSTAKKLADVLVLIEDFYGDPSIIFDGASLHLRTAKQGAKDALKAIREYYET